VSVSSLVDGDLLVWADGPVLTVTINRPSMRNAICARTWRALRATFSQAAKRQDIRVVILRGAGAHFSSGADINELLQIVRSDRATGDDYEAREYWRLVYAANSAIEACPQPVIAMVAGFAFGAALALAMACDLRIAAAHSRWGVPAPQIGLTLGASDTRRLVLSVGAARAAEILITGRRFTAERAAAMGLVTDVVDADELETSTYKLAAELAHKCAPLAIREAKANIAAIARGSGLSCSEEPSTPIAWAGSADLEEGISAFLEGRDPFFQGH